jgi:S-formylglutathione hydrolase FrmB
MKKVLIPVFILLFLFKGIAATVDTVSIYSEAMKKSFNCVVIKPSNYKKEKKGFPVVYLLHGYSGAYNNWINRVPALKEYADNYTLLIVCPDGGYSSWYFDSPVDSTIRYETYIGKEVPAFIDKHFKTIKDRKARAITGLSMGGHGGLFIGLRHSGTFGACGSMSGGVELYSSRNKFHLAKRLGDTISHANNWKNYSVTTVIETKTSDSLAIIIDCGTEDFFYTINKALHEKMLKLKINHDYIERPGNHDWDYWRNAVKYQLLYFREYFQKMDSAK